MLGNTMVVHRCPILCCQLLQPPMLKPLLLIRMFGSCSTCLCQWLRLGRFAALQSSTSETRFVATDVRWKWLRQKVKSAPICNPGMMRFRGGTSAPQSSCFQVPLEMIFPPVSSNLDRSACSPLSEDRGGGAERRQRRRRRRRTCQ